MPTSQNNLHSDSIPLPVKGQGVFVFQNPQQKPFEVNFFTEKDQVYLSFQMKKNISYLLITQKGKTTKVGTYQVGIDPEPNALYWISINGSKKVIRFGIGEARKELKQIDQQLEISWLLEISKINLSNGLKFHEIQKNPIVGNTPMLVQPISTTHTEVITKNNYITQANLKPYCQTLYAGLLSKAFKLDMPDFPEFTQAIEKSIHNPKGWCYQKLDEKAKEFNSLNEAYLRINLEMNQNNSSEISYLLEIWPPGYCSPIHSHAQSHAMIQILHGNILVRLFSMLSPFHQKPFLEYTFNQDDITWISPKLNQIHQLKNTHPSGPTCMTLHCYKYNQKNTMHRQCFDWLDSKGKIKQFDPKSDMDFSQFKDTMKKEWST